jgi:hypothetical protein
MKKKTTLQQNINSLEELDKEKDELFKKTINGWRHTLALWGYYNKVDLIVNLLILISGILLGLGWGRYFK